MFVCICHATQKSQQAISLAIVWHWRHIMCPAVRAQYLTRLKRGIRSCCPCWAQSTQWQSSGDISTHAAIPSFPLNCAGSTHFSYDSSSTVFRVQQTHILTIYDHHNVVYQTRRSKAPASKHSMMPLQRPLCEEHNLNDICDRIQPHHKGTNIVLETQCTFGSVCVLRMLRVWFGICVTIYVVYGNFSGQR